MNDSKWNPRPDGRYGTAARKDYHAGYSDGFYKATFGECHAEPQEAYRSGYTDGKADSPATPSVRAS